MSYNTWYNESKFLVTDQKYYKFFLNATAAPNSAIVFFFPSERLVSYAFIIAGCPIIMLELQSNYGEINIAIAAGRKPTFANYDFLHYAWTKDTLYGLIHPCLEFHFAH